MRSVLLITIAAISISSVAQAEKKKKAAPTPMTGKRYVVDRIIDGDTFKAGDTKIRIWGIQAPEKNERGYWSAGYFLENLLIGETVECHQRQRSKSYKRIVMQCFINGQDIAIPLLRSGWFKEAKKYTRGHYAEEEQVARKAQKGIWRTVKQ